MASIPNDLLRTLLIKYAGVPPKEAALVANELDELRQFDTEAALLADLANVRVGSFAYAIDTGAVFLRGAAEFTAVALDGAGFLGTEGSVLFAGVGGVIAEDNTNFFWDDTADRLSIIGESSVLGAGVRSEQHGLDAQASALDSTALGNAAIASGSRSVAVGEDAKGQGNDSTAIGKSAIATSVGGTAIGQAASALNNVATALGKLAIAASLRDTALGSSASASGSDSTAVGYAAVSGFGSVALGKDASATIAGSMAFGKDATVQAAHTNAVAIGITSSTTAAQRVTLGKVGGIAAELQELQVSDGFAAFGATPPASQPTAIADASGGATVDAEARTAINALLAAMRANGLIAT